MMTDPRRTRIAGCLMLKMMRSIALTVLTSWILSVGVDAQGCGRTRCQLPDCHCPSPNPPGQIDAAETPQMVLVVFEGTVDGDVLVAINKSFPLDPPTSRRNPNRCPMVSTVFVRGQRTDYCAVNRVWARGHEIGVNGQAQHTSEYWRTATLQNLTEWTETLLGQLDTKAKVPLTDIYGSRTPYLVPNEEYFKMLHELTFEYDSTLIMLNGLDTASPPTFPFTMDTPLPFNAAIRCDSGECPQGSYEDLWQVPVLKSFSGTAPCTYYDLCGNLAEMNGDDVFELIKTNFDRHYTTARVPFIINIHTSFIKAPELAASLVEGLNAFLDHVSDADDIWVVTMHQAIEWMRTPRSISDIDSLAAWGCQSHAIDSKCKIIGLSEDGTALDKEDAAANKTQVGLQKLFEGQGQNIVIWQTVFLVVVYLVILKIDRSGGDK